MESSSKRLIGEHDFRNFCKMDAANVHNYKRRITSFSICPCNGRFETLQQLYRSYVDKNISLVYLMLDASLLIGFILVIGVYNNLPCFIICLRCIFSFSLYYEGIFVSFSLCGSLSLE